MSRDERGTAAAARDLVALGAAAHGREEIFRLLVESVRDYAIFVLDPSGRVASWNTGAERIKGYAADEIIGRHFSVFYPPEDVAAGKCEHELEVAAQVGRFEDEGIRLRKDGTAFWANVVISAMRDDRGRLVGFSKVTRDLSERRRAEEEQRARLAAEERFRQLIESVHDYAIFMLDPGGRVATWNAGAARINGYAADEIIGRHFSVFYRPDDAATGICEHELEVAAREGRFEAEGWRVRKDGSQLWVNVVIGAVRDGEGRLVGFSKVTRDLTERTRAEEEQTARRAAEQANRAKDEFLAMLGHELRNPLAPIVTALELMKLRGPGPAPKEQEVIERQVNHMVSLVDDLLDVSRIARGKIDLKRRPLDLGEVVGKAIEVASPLLEQHRHHLAVDLPSTPIVVSADEARLTQVIANLLTNAAKYTEPGGHVAVGVRLEGDEAVVDVTDDGVGIAPDLLPRVFDLFVQGYQGAERAAGGLGLGLTVVRNLIQLHGGAVSAHSDGAGRGSRFTVRLPCGPAVGAAPGAAAATPSPAPERVARVLLFDDNDDARDMLAEVLMALGHEVATAGDPLEAIELAARFRPTVAVLDIGLPVIDGYELAVRLRGRLGAATPRLIALTGYGQANDRARSSSAGFDEHLVKPVELARLIAALDGPPA